MEKSEKVTNGLFATSLASPFAGAAIGALAGNVAAGLGIGLACGLVLNEARIYYERYLHGPPPNFE